FVQQHAREQAKGTDGTGGPVCERGVIGNLQGKISERESPREQEKRDKPRVVNTYAYSRDRESVYCRHVDLHRQDCNLEALMSLTFQISKAGFTQSTAATRIARSRRAGSTGSHMACRFV